MKLTLLAGARRVVVTGALALVALCLLPATSSAAARWTGSIFWGPTVLQPGDRAGFRVEVGNVGDEQAVGWPTVEIALPAGVAFHESDAAAGGDWTCDTTGSPETVTCVNPAAASAPFSWPKPGTYVGEGTRPSYIQFTVEVAADAPTGKKAVKVTISGGGAVEATTVEEEIQIGGPPAGFGAVESSLEVEALGDAGEPFVQAGGHPEEAVGAFTPTLDFVDPAASGDWVAMLAPVAYPKDLVIDFPAGLVGNPLAAPACTLGAVLQAQCPPESQVGVAELANLALPQVQMMAIYNVVPNRGAVAEFVFRTPAGPVLLTPILRSDGDWGLSVRIRSVTEATPLFHLGLRLWGVPADPSHDTVRCPLPSHVGPVCAGYDASGEPDGSPFGSYDPHPSTAPRKAFLIDPTYCSGSPQVAVLHESAWTEPAVFEPDGDPDLSDPGWVDFGLEAPPIEGCEALEFDPTLKARPTTPAADSPSGLDVDIHIPQAPDPDGLATAHLRRVEVELPDGLAINPAGANGLGACSPAQVHLADRLPDDCPQSAKLGAVEVETPLQPQPLVGAIYLATPYENPFGSLLAIYVAIDDRESGIVGKLPGFVVADPETGRLTATFEETPQLPFEDVELSFFGGGAATFRTPSVCGVYATTSRLTPYSAPASGPPAAPEDVYAISRGANGTACASAQSDLPSVLTFESGSTSLRPGAHAPFVVSLSRKDGSKRFSALTLNLPPGLTADLADTRYCPDGALARAASSAGRREQSEPSCPTGSRIGSVSAGAGAGSTPYFISGTVYLAGPYEGAPLSLAVVIPAVAGPFDLGTVVTRVAIRIDPRTARVTAASDPLPQILHGIPLDLRLLSIRLDKPGFTVNPTSCDPGAVSGTLQAAPQEAVALHSHFQLGECGRLGFKPKLALRLLGPTHRSAHPRLRLSLRPRAGDANIRRATVLLPATEIFETRHIRDVCTRGRYAEGSCPARSVYGYAKAWSPLLDEPLAGPIYLRASNRELPDLVASLDGQVHVDLVAGVDSVASRIRTTLRGVPDVPLTRAVLSLKGGKDGLFVNNADLCRARPRAAALLVAHNDKTRGLRPSLRSDCN